MKTKYTAINIGPILSTFALVRKPAELWAASYIFSYLMKCIIDEIPSERIISPARLPKDADKTIGLYPDRLFVKGEVQQKVLDDALMRFAATINFEIPLAKEYFNIMRVTIEVEENTEEDKKKIIPKLNRLLDRMELCNLHVNEEAREAVWQYLTKKKDYLSNVTKKKLRNPSIETIASINIFKKENETEDKETPENIKDKSDKYICIVQADGDNMGKAISNLPMADISTLSEKLLKFGQQSCELIRKDGGLPIYAGGDDLLFMVPVSSTQGTIYDLITEIDDEYKPVQEYIKEKNENKITTSMSYGISMTYGKFPLYEALAAAQKLLFNTAKNVSGKNALAWMLQKHSGSSFKATFSKENEKLYAAFKTVIAKTEDDQLVSAVAHKLRSNTGLLSLWLGEENADKLKMRLDNFFEKIIDVETKNEANRQYINSVKVLLKETYAVADQLCTKNDSKEEMSNLEKMEKVIDYVYGMLRTAKFIKGKEEDKWQNI